MIKIALAILASLLMISCGSPKYASSQPSVAKSSTPMPLSKKRAEPAAPFVDFGAVNSAGQLALVFNRTLFDEQAQEQCDTRQVEIPSTWTPPRCTLRGLAGCRVYENRPGEPAPACKIKNQNGPCMLSEDPKPPNPRYTSQTECYRAEQEEHALGRITLYAVPATARVDQVLREGRPLVNFDLVSNKGEQLVQVPSVGATECLALADARGKVISVRQSGAPSIRHLFTTPMAIDERKRATALSAIEQAKKQAVSLRSDAAQYARNAQESAAWRGNACTAPVAQTIPSAPRFMSADEVGDQARGSCAIVLANKIGVGTVIKAIDSMQAYEYRTALQKYGERPEKYDKCTWRAYNYSPEVIARLTGETTQYIAGQMPQSDNMMGNAMGFIGALLKGVQTEVSTTTSNKQQMTLSELNNCASTVSRACNAPRDAWDNKVSALNAEPRLALERCQSSITNARDTLKKAEEAEKEAARMQAEIMTKPADTEALTLNLVTCGS